MTSEARQLDYSVARQVPAAGLTYLPPREPAILGDVWLQVLQK